ncbi:MAG: cysteinyl-tRNA synthetase [Gammaproteobacteria bacterium]|jgi:cysteinyl-tRNA synthetase|nr:cysteinyl-tRNA synthetase [Gammaproteobacteria bacterium]
MLKIYNSLTKQKEVFKPLHANKVSLYVCGVTVYDHCHIGHARTYLAFDLVLRFLRMSGYQVTYVRNITDIDDKIIKRSQESGQSTDELVAKYTELMHHEFASLNILPPDSEPKATQTIPEIIQMISQLIDKGYAYSAENGDVYYSVKQFKDYGKLSGQNLDQLQVGSRVDINEAKRGPLDFVLWKAAKPGEPAWDSPWGEGRPGWHIECSAMTKKCLGQEFDIHGGGSDLRFPHHENEIAQSEAANDGHFARYWMHSGMVQVNSEKMSKSLGNFFIISDVLKQYPAEVLRYFLISGHYRSEINYSDENLQSAQAALTRLYNALRGLPKAEQCGFETDYQQRFIAAMNDDFNTPEALAVLFDLAREINKLKEVKLERAAQLGALLKNLAAVLGILQQDPEAFLKGDAADVQIIEALIAKRNAARSNKDWAAADQARAELTKMNIIIEDNPSGTSWRRA